MFMNKRLSVIKVSVPPNWIYGFSATSVRIPAGRPRKADRTPKEKNQAGALTLLEDARRVWKEPHPAPDSEGTTQKKEARPPHPTPSLRQTSLGISPPGTN